MIVGDTHVVDLHLAKENRGGGGGRGGEEWRKRADRTVGMQEIYVTHSRKRGPFPQKFIHGC